MRRHGPATKIDQLFCKTRQSDTTILSKPTSHPPSPLPHPPPVSGIRPPHISLGYPPLTHLHTHPACRSLIQSLRLASWKTSKSPAFITAITAGSEWLSGNHPLPQAHHPTATGSCMFTRLPLPIIPIRNKSKLPITHTSAITKLHPRRRMEGSQKQSGRLPPFHRTHRLTTQ